MAKISFLPPSPTPQKTSKSEVVPSGIKVDSTAPGRDAYIRVTQSGTARYTVDTTILPSAPPWSIVEKFGYALHSPIWWTRRITVSKLADASNVATFVSNKGLWDAAAGTATAVIRARALKKLDIERHFWWISNAQIQKLANGLSAVHRQNNDCSHSLENLVANALFDMPLKLQGEP